MPEFTLPSGGLRPISHISYAVENISSAVDHWHRILGAGPFFLVERVTFDEVTSRGEPAVWDHAAAFGQWGSISIELQQIFSASPSWLVPLFTPGPLPVINHVAFITETPEDDSAQLSAAGYEQFLHARFGGVDVRFHDTRAALGHAVEIHRASDELEAAFERIAAASRGWDGTDPLRPMGHTPQ
ncbi:MAG: VOC family protein [Microbacteriaceae bacterium]